jgi:uncharacterized protein YggU (UPF0235/DUF167 family)
MKINITVKPNSKTQMIEKIDDQNYILKFNVLPVDNAANKKVIEMLSEYFNIPKTTIKIIRGHKSKSKVVEF